MKTQSLLITALSILAACCFSGCRNNTTSPSAIQGKIDLSSWNFDKNGSTELKGEWEFYWDTLISPREINSVPLVNAPVFVKTPQHWQGSSVNGIKLPYYGKATYRIQIHLPDTKNVYALSLIQAISSYRIWVDTVLITEQGVIPESGRNFEAAYAPGVISFTPPQQTFTLIIQVACYVGNSGGLYSTLRIGKESDLFKERLRYLSLRMLVLSFILLVGLYQGFLFFTGQRDRINLYLSMLCVNYAALMALTHDAQLLALFPHLSFPTFIRLYIAVNHLIMVFLPLSFNSLFPKEVPRRPMFSIALIYSVLLAIQMIDLDLALSFSFSNILSFLVSSSSIIFFIGALIVAAFRKRHGALVMLIAFCIQAIQATVMFRYGLFGGIVVDPGLPTAFGLIGCQIAIHSIRRARSQREAALRGENAAQAEKLAAMGTLVAGVAHEINNPNNAILLNTSMIAHSWEGLRPILDRYAAENGDFMVGGFSYSELREEFEESIIATKRNSERIRGIVEDLRSITRKEERQYNEEVDCNTVIRSALGVIGELIRRSTRNFHVDYGTALPFINGNGQRLEQVIINIVKNACESLTDNQKSVCIASGFDQVRNEVIITVRDEGEGMDEETRKKILNPFFTTKGSAEGTGLGLSICTHIVKNHHGTLKIESLKGNGTTVTLTFPAVNNSLQQTATSAITSKVGV
jgi:signal transduction histidine kinase